MVGVSHVDEHDQLDTYRPRWFSHEITPQAWLWIFEKGDRPSLAVLIIMKVCLFRRQFRAQVDTGPGSPDSDRHS